MYSANSICSKVHNKTRNAREDLGADGQHEFRHAKAILGHPLGPLLDPCLHGCHVYLRKSVVSMQTTPQR